MVFNPFDASLPQFQTKDEKGVLNNKSYKVPVTFDVRKILNFLYENLGVKKSIIDPGRD